MMGFLRTLHAWAGLALCLFLATLALSGAALSWKPEWLRATVPGAAQAYRTTPDSAAQAIAAAEAAFGPKAVRGISFAGGDIGLHEVMLKEGAAYIDPDTGSVVQRWRKNGRVVDVVFDLHHHFLSGRTGTKVVGAVGLIAAIMVTTGLIIWLPAARSFAGRWRPRGGRSGWLAAHRDLGVMVAPVALVITLTGASMGLNDLTDLVLRIPEREAPPKVGKGRVDWPSALKAAQAMVPDARLRGVNLGGPRPPSIRMQRAGEWNTKGRTVAFVDPATSEIARLDDALAKPARVKLRDAFWPVHANRVGGLAWTIVNFIGGLALAALAIYGAESYRRKLFPGR